MLKKIEGQEDPEAPFQVPVPWCYFKEVKLNKSKIAYKGTKRFIDNMTAIAQGDQNYTQRSAFKERKHIEKMEQIIMSLHHKLISLELSFALPLLLQ